MSLRFDQDKGVILISNDSIELSMKQIQFIISFKFLGALSYFILCLKYRGYDEMRCNKSLCYKSNVMILRFYFIERRSMLQIAFITSFWLWFLQHSIFTGFKQNLFQTYFITFVMSVNLRRHYSTKSII